MTAADVLDKAADLLWVRGRTTGEGVDSEGRLCLVGAVWLASLRLNAFDEPARQCLGEFLGVDQHAVYLWNDALPITPDNGAFVVDQLRRCAKDLRERET